MSKDFPWATASAFHGSVGPTATAFIVDLTAKIFAIARPGDKAGQESARKLGTAWAGGSDEIPPKKLDAAIIFAPVGALVPAALRALVKGGTVVCGGIHMSDIPSFPYVGLWGERA